MILSYLNIGIGNLIPLFYTPVMLSILGQSEYGLYKLASSTTSYLSLMAFGVGSAVTRYLIKAKTEAGKEQVENVFGLFNLIFQAIALLTCLVGVVVAGKLDLFYSDSLNAEELFRMRILVIILTVNTAVGFAASSYNAVVSSYERFIFIHLLNVITTIGIPIINLIVLYMGYKSIGLAMASLVLSVVVRVGYIVYVRKVLDIKPRYNNMPVEIIKEVLVFSFWIFVSNIVAQLYNATDTVIIGAIPILATAGVAVYSIGTTFSNMLFSLAQVTPGLFMPQVNKMVFCGATDRELTELVIKVGRMQCFVVSLVCSGFIAFGIPFINIYAGPDYSEAYWVALIIMIPSCIPLVQSAAHSVIQAKNMHKFRAKVYILMAVVNVVCTYLLVHKYGIVGAAIPTGGSYILGNGIIMNWYYWKKVHLDIPKFWKEIVPIFAVAVPLCVITLISSRYIDYFNIRNMFIGIVVYAIVYLIIQWCLVMRKSEKNVVTGIVRRLINK